MKMDGCTVIILKMQIILKWVPMIFVGRENGTENLKILNEILILLNLKLI